MNNQLKVCVKVYVETNLNSQSDGVEQDEDKHDIFKSSGVDDGPELVLNRILWDVEFEWLSLQRILDTLTLHDTQC